MILLVPDGADSILHKIPAYIKTERMDAYHTFECAAFDAIFRTFYDLEIEGFVQLAEQISEALSVYRQKGIILPAGVQENMRNYKNQLAHALQRITAVKTLLIDLIGDEEEMALMNLSLLHERPNLYR